MIIIITEVIDYYQYWIRFNLNVGGPNLSLIIEAIIEEIHEFFELGRGESLSDPVFQLVLCLLSP